MLLKILDENDYNQFYQLVVNNHDRLKRYFPNTTKGISDKDAVIKRLIENKTPGNKKTLYTFGLFDQSQLIAYINVKNIDWDNLKCELGYFIDQAYEGRGLMTKYVGQVCNFCFEKLKLSKIFLRIGPENIGSKKTAEKNGFIKEGTLRKEFKIETGEWIDVEYYGKLRDS